MANLLDKASILITPTAYSDGKIHSAKPIQSLSAEKVVNGDFSNGSTDWTLENGWSIGLNKATYDGLGNSKEINQDVVTEPNKTYLIKYEIKDIQATKQAYFNISGGGSGSPLIQPYTLHNVGSYEFYYNSSVSGDILKFNALNSSNGGSFSITNISVKEVIDADLNFTRGSAATRVNAQGLIENVDTLGSERVSNGDFSNGSTDWTKGASWSIANGFASSDGSSSNSFSQTSPILEVGKTYLLNFDLSSYVSGTLLLLGGSYQTQETFTSNGSYNIFIIPKYTTFAFYGSTFNGSIDNISVKEVIDVTNIPRIDY